MLVELRAVFFIHFSPGWGPPGAGLMYSLIVPSPIRILIGSISMYPSVLPASIYSACKAGVIQVTTVWAMELAEFGIRVNCISPGAIVTQIFWGGYGTEDPEENARKAERLAEYFAEVLPLKRAGLPEDIAGAAVFLASDESLHTTGHNLKVDSGITVGRDRAFSIANNAERERRLGLRD